MVAWLPLMLARLPLSLPILCVGLGAGLSLLPGMPRLPNPLGGSALAEHLAELCVLVSLMGAGLKLDRPLSRRGWHVTWRLLGITMPLSIAILAVAGWMFAGLAFSTALLLGAALAPTDPVLAGDIQVGPPGDDGHDEERDEVRFSADLRGRPERCAGLPLRAAGPGHRQPGHHLAHPLVRLRRGAEARDRHRGRLGHRHADRPRRIPAAEGRTAGADPGGVRVAGDHPADLRDRRAALPATASSRCSWPASRCATPNAATATTATCTSSPRASSTC